MTTTNEIETGYPNVGTGCVGMAFVDHSPADVVMVDGHGRPGGHWNDAYPFVTLRQPSFFYGVASTPLGRDRIDTAHLRTTSPSGEERRRCGGTPSWRSAPCDRIASQT